MKKAFTIIFLLPLLFSTAFAQVVYDDFEFDRNISFGNDVGYLGGELVLYTPNPDMVGNTSSYVATYVRDPSDSYAALVMYPPGNMTDVADYEAGTKSITIDVWSPGIGIEVLVSLEDKSMSDGAAYPAGRHSRYQGFTTVASGWETITLSYLDSPDASVDDANVDWFVLLLNPGTNTNDTYYLDNIMGPAYADPCPSPAADSTLFFEDFDCNRNMIPEFTSGWISKEANPLPNATNNSDWVGKVVTSPDTSGTDVVVCQLAGEVSFMTHNQAHMLVRTFTGGSVSVSMQDGTVEKGIATATYVGNGTWEELTFDFSMLTDTTGVDHCVLLFHQGLTSIDSVWFDNFELDGFETVSREELISTNYSLHQNAPNPFSDYTDIRFDLMQPGVTSINVYDIQGHLVRTLMTEQKMQVGSHAVRLSKDGMAPGVYFYTLTVDGLQETKKLIVR